MEDTKIKILRYLELKFSITKWNFTSLVKLKNLYGTDTEEALKALQSEGLVFPNKGVNGIVIQYIIGEEKKEKVRVHFLKTNKQ